MIYTITHKETGEPALMVDGRPYAYNDPGKAGEALQKMPERDAYQIEIITNVDIVKMMFDIRALHKYLTSEKFSKDESVDRKDVLTRLGLY